MAVLSRLANLVLKQLSTKPASPPTGSTTLYPKVDQALYTVDASGVERTFPGLRPVKASSTDLLTLSGEQAVDDIFCSAGDIVLVRHQGVYGGNADDNGIYQVATGAWTKLTMVGDQPGTSGHQFLVTRGTKFRGAVFTITFDELDPLGITARFWLTNRVDIGNIFQQPQVAGRGQEYYNSVNRYLSIWDGLAWSMPKGIQDYSSSAPAYPKTGELWYDSGAPGVDTGTYPFFKGVISAATALTTATNVTFTAQEDNRSGWSTNVYTAPQTGMYRLHVQFKWNGTSPAGPPAIQFMKSGSGAFVSGQLPNTPAFGCISQVAYIRATFGQTFAVQILQNGFTTQSDAPVENNFFIIEYVRA